MRIVMADDDKVVVQMLSAGLRKRGSEVIAAFDAMQAVMASMKQAPDAIVMDLNMPGGTGVEAVRRIKGSTKTGIDPDRGDHRLGHPRRVRARLSSGRWTSSRSRWMWKGWRSC